MEPNEEKKDRKIAKMITEIMIVFVVFMLSYNCVVSVNFAYVHELGVKIILSLILLHLVLILCNLTSRQFKKVNQKSIFYFTCVYILICVVISVHSYFVEKETYKFVIQSVFNVLFFFVTRLGLKEGR